MKYGIKEISDLSDTELIEASQRIVSMHGEFSKKRNTWDYLAKRKTRDVPPANPNFVTLKNEIETELNKRKIEL